MKPLRLHWASSKPNFGDVLSPLICARVAGRSVVWAPAGECDLVALGSLMQRVKERFWNKRISVWGAGFIAAEKPHRSRHRLCALRGKLSAAIVGAGDEVALGDPGLLASLLIEHEPPPATRRGCLIIPHYKDRDCPELLAAVRDLAGVELVDVFSPPLEILRRIRAAEVVLSSAMHGLIAADSLGVPNAWLKVSDALRGGDFKFRDYYSVFGIEPPQIGLNANLLHDASVIVDTYRRPGIEMIKDGLLRSFPPDLAGAPGRPQRG
ncbi:polysaccharide pyruvyl transferase family protein [Aromatoleum anaerobium]|uniref:Polysaccharide pyruvyl transferase family protein n=1 Tax=Aromatoleum anaerobium TaxID=182180 RepID=A0ABX1PND7_9RHOO|nr:polysaccharide pyruvyl transferase family protein [Aromatoleum anaerobium]MCK0507045.1 polysaccharide pyruvyl transferase family protein [Aromatoleum anaerobium]